MPKDNEWRGLLPESIYMGVRAAFESGLTEKQILGVVSLAIGLWETLDTFGADAELCDRLKTIVSSMRKHSDVRPIKG